ncbi:MAG TPA: hypothetical protein VHJ58_18170, partial [Vicinamibacterales bacterium]|nr:hypothetical protein [Vicinamibacterales bacterium]
QEALSWIDEGFRLNPFGLQFFHSTTSMVLFCAREYAKAILSFGRITTGLAHPWNCVYAIASYGHLDQREKAQAIIAHYHSLAPALPLLEYASHEPFKHKADLDHLMDGLRKAGVPD